MSTTTSHCFIPILPTYSQVQFLSSKSTHVVRKRPRVFSVSQPRCVQQVVETPEPVSLPRPQSRRSFKKPGAKPRTAAEGDSLQSTPWQWSLLLSFAGLSLSLFTKVCTDISSPSQVATTLAAVFSSYVFADLAIGIYHHAVDNYGSADTPVVGYQIAAFQGHHSYPWTIASRDLANNLYRLVYPTGSQMLALLALPLPEIVTAFYGSFLFFIVLSQETHRQAHMTRAAPWVRALQERGIIVSQRAHMMHHHDPFYDNYCILSGWWNGLLDRTLFFRRLEAVIYKFTDIQPICWKLDPVLKDQALSLWPKEMFQTER